MYALKQETKLSYEDAVKKVKEELQKEGFGVLTEIDVKATLKEKLDVDYDDYIILGACNPPFAYKALQAEQDIGLLLPCNVIVYRKEEETVVAAVDPVEAMSIIENKALEKIAVEIRQRLQRVLKNTH